MKKYFYLFFLLPFFSLNAQDVESVIDKYFKAINQDKLLKVQSIVSKGKIKQMGAELSLTIYQKRPDMVRVESSFSGQNFIQTFDGKKGWNLNPFTGSTEPKEMTTEEAAQAKDQADIDGFLYNYKAKGSVVTLLPDEDLNGVNAHVISVMKADSSVIKSYINPENNFIVKTIMNMNGADIVSELKDYKDFDGVMMPSLIETNVNGQIMMQITFDEVKFDQDIPDTLFGKPEVSPQ